jgi:hypothetical protein
MRGLLRPRSARVAEVALENLWESVGDTAVDSRGCREFSRAWYAGYSRPSKTEDVSPGRVGVGQVR